MKRFYQDIDIRDFDGNSFNGNVFVGVQFKDHEGGTVKSIKQHFYKDIWWDDEFQTMPTEESNICGIETDAQSGWIVLGGPIKGSYAV